MKNKDPFLKEQSTPEKVWKLAANTLGLGGQEIETKNRKIRKNWTEILIKGNVVYTTYKKDNGEIAVHRSDSRLKI